LTTGRAGRLVSHWIVDLEGASVEVHRSPSAAGFQSVQRVGLMATLSPLAFPDVEITTTTILG
jgi:hypothetical protein